MLDCKRAFEPGQRCKVSVIVKRSIGSRVLVDFADETASGFAADSKCWFSDRALEPLPPEPRQDAPEQPRLTKSYREHLAERLTTAERICDYLEALLEDGDVDVLKLGVQNVVRAWKDNQSQPQRQDEPLKVGAALIAAERQRQIEKEGWTPDHDDEHGDGQLLDAAICYAVASTESAGSAWQSFIPRESIADRYWPWSPQWWKPTPNDRVRQLVKAGALIAAEIDRELRGRGQRIEPPAPPAPAASEGYGGIKTLYDVIGTAQPRAEEAATKHRHHCTYCKDEWLCNDPECDPEPRDIAWSKTCDKCNAELDGKTEVKAGEAGDGAVVDLDDKAFLVIDGPDLFQRGFIKAVLLPDAKLAVEQAQRQKFALIAAATKDWNDQVRQIKALEAERNKLKRQLETCSKSGR